MRIGIITDETDTQLVGFGTYTLKLTKNILEQDKKNEYFLIHRRKEDHEIYKMGAKEIIIPSGMFPFSALRNFITLPWKLRKYNLDVVHHMTSTGPFAFKFLFNFKAVETIHEIEPVLYPKNFEFLVRTVFRLFLPRIARNSAHIFTACNSAKMDIHNHYGVPLGRITVVQTATDPLFKTMNRKAAKDKIKKKYGIKDNYILYLSTLEKKKNVPTLIRAMRKLKDSGVKHKLVLVGRKGYKYDEIESEIKKLGLENEVIQPGYVPLDDLPVFYNAADAFVFPAYEGLCLPVADAMKCGCPVVVSKGGGGEETFGKAALTVDIMDVEGYAAAVMKVLGDGKLANSMRKKGLVLVKPMTWENLAKKTIKVYEMVGSISSRKL
jgi:glycosyltransferase involved in cell wall biosynthesis